ncbi:hypothetical protein SSX86_014419 [Deinandra increscens subsp. villosa]|uniref:LOB domain-containing protein n=1 Tax=Deinandra increscens subsp. villosa TaxID=3103831 RepID=A0AAP0GZT4_9ASTR
MSDSNISCAACKHSRRRCKKDCVFAPYFPLDQPHKFESVHRIFGASKVARILKNLPAAQRKAAVDSLVYEAEARLKDPVYGCVASISLLRKRLMQVQTELDIARQELATYKGPPVLNPGFMPQFSNWQVPVTGSNLERMLGLDQPGTSGEGQHGQQSCEALRQQLVEAARKQDMLRKDMLRNLKQKHHPQQTQNQHHRLLRFNRRFDGAGPSGQATRPAELTGSGAMLQSFSFCEIQQQEELCDHILEQLIEHETMVQQQNQPSQLLQPNDGDGGEEGRSV